MTPLLIPNNHVALIHFPIALLLLGIAGELVCAIAYRQSTARAAARWMLLLGAALGWPALYSGLYALHHVGGEDFQTWADMRANSPVLSNPATWEMLREHLILNAAATVLASVVVVVWLMGGERARRALHAPGVLGLLVATALILIGAWHGGELVYWHDVTGIAHSPGLEATTQRAVQVNLRSLVPPLDMHVTMAGATTGLCLLTWAVAARSRRVRVPAEPVTAIGDAQTDRIFAAFQPATVEAIAEPPPATLGWIATFAGLATALLGAWVLSDAFESRSPRVLWTAILDRENAVGPVSRRLAHVIAGMTVVLLPAVVAWVGTRARMSRAVPLVIGSVMLGAIGVQTWFGVLLLLDSNVGSLTGFNP